MDSNVYKYKKQPPFMGFIEKRGKSIDNDIISFLKKQSHPISTREISTSLKLSWHTAINHCLRLQMNNKIEGYKIANLNVWAMKK
jgi:hypothetical protein